MFACISSTRPAACAALICANAVPALPDTGRSGGEALCRSHPGELVTPDRIPVRNGGAHYAPSRNGAQKSLPLVTIVVGFDGLPYENGFDWHEALFSGSKSLAAYYTDMSFGKFTFVPAPETSAFGVGDNANTADSAPFLLLLQARKQGRRGLTVMPTLAIRDGGGKYTEEIMSIYRRDAEEV